MKASEKQGICKKIAAVLKKRYKKSPPQMDRPVLDIILHAICLENVSEERAEASFTRLLTDFHDYNELRVSSLTELETAFNGADQSEYRALRVRTVLQDIFENLYRYDFESLRKKTLDAAAKQLRKLRHLSDFVCNFTLQAALGAHVVPVDRRMRTASVWLGLAPVDASETEAAQALKPALRKADAPNFCYLLRHLATDPVFVKTFESAAKKPAPKGYDPLTAVDRLNELIKSGSRKTRTPKRKAAARSQRPAAAKKQSSAKKRPSAKKRSPAKKKVTKRSSRKTGAASATKKKSKRSVTRR